MCIYVCIRIQACVNFISCLSLSISILFYLGSCLSTNPELTFLVIPATQKDLRVHLSLPSPSVDERVCASALFFFSFFCGCSGPNLRSLCLFLKNFTIEPFSQPPRKHCFVYSSSIHLWVRYQGIRGFDSCLFFFFCKKDRVPGGRTWCWLFSRTKFFQRQITNQEDGMGNVLYKKW